MAKIRFPVAVLVATLACDSPADVGTVTERVPAYVLFGSVRDEAGTPIGGATAEIISDAFRGRIAFSNAHGNFSFKDVQGYLIVRVWKDGYDHHKDWLTVSGDRQYEVRLMRVETDSIRLGQTIRSSIQPHAPPCDPIGWDARAPCRRLAITPPISGRLTLTVTWFGGSEVDANLTTSDGRYVAFSSETDIEEITTVADVGAGERYELWVSSYYEPQIFNLKADLVPFLPPD